jgi:plasmid stabilization system protein ParE
MKVLFTDEAEKDLEAIGDWIAGDNPTRAISFVGELRGKCENLNELPRAFPVVARYGSLEIRRRAWRDYLILYQIRSQDILVLHVIHGAQDYDILLPPVS